MAARAKQTNDNSTPFGTGVDGPSDALTVDNDERIGQVNLTQKLKFGKKDGPPKVDPGDSGAKVGEADASKITARVAEALAPEQRDGYRGFNPDPRPNSEYTVAGVTKKYNVEVTTQEG